MPTLLDDVFPIYDISSRHTISIAAPPGEVYTAARRADLGAPRLVKTLMFLRTIPALFATAFRQHSPELHRTNQRRVGRLPFTVLAEVPGDEFVLGIMGRFWTPSGGVVAATADDFGRPPRAGLAQAAWNFRVTPSGNGTILSTETRVRCSDEDTRRRFGRYWTVVRLGSGLIRNSMLRHIRSEAERTVPESARSQAG